MIQCLSHLSMAWSSRVSGGNTQDSGWILVAFKAVLDEGYRVGCDTLSQVTVGGE